MPTELPIIEFHDRYYAEREQRLRREQIGDSEAVIVRHSLNVVEALGALANHSHPCVRQFRAEIEEINEVDGLLRVRVRPLGEAGRRQKLIRSLTVNEVDLICKRRKPSIERGYFLPFDYGMETITGL